MNSFLLTPSAAASLITRHEQHESDRRQRAGRGGKARVARGAEARAGRGQALVRIEASGVNFIDAYDREGFYPLPLPFTPGSEARGSSKRSAMV
ncbi:MAG TPA: hypothetical protein VN605_07540 [Thermoanaerobaculia bacterium]|nr:hypothetical protein [Thermoanaerobaculia bacterium]